MIYHMEAEYYMSTGPYYNILKELHTNLHFILLNIFHFFKKSPLFSQIQRFNDTLNTRTLDLKKTLLRL